MLHLKCSMHWRFIYCIQRRTSAPPLDLVAGMRMLVTTNKPFGNMLVDDITGESVHKVLGAGFTGTELSQAVILLLVEHLAVLYLGVNIGANLCLAVF